MLACSRRVPDRGRRPAVGDERGHQELEDADVRPARVDGVPVEVGFAVRGPAASRTTIDAPLLGGGGDVRDDLRLAHGEAPRARRTPGGWTCACGAPAGFGLVAARQRSAAGPGASSDASMTLVRRSTSPTDERTREADAATPWAGVVMSTAVAGPATIIRQPRTRPRARLGKCNADHSCLVGLPAFLPWPGLVAARPLLPLWRLSSRCSLAP